MDLLLLFQRLLLTIMFSNTTREGEERKEGKGEGCVGVWVCMGVWVCGCGCVCERENVCICVLGGMLPTVVAMQLLHYHST